MKAVGLISGGLDSALAAKIMMDMGIEIIGVHFSTPFSSAKVGASAKRISELLGFPIRIVKLGREYFEILADPRYGYGAAMNPCIDCKILMLRKAKELMAESGAGFIFTGEVLGERPMSQTPWALRVIERESGLEGLLLRPLSAKLLGETLVERMGWVKRDGLLALRGRSRREQIRMAKELGITGYLTPAGGCLLTDRGFSAKLLDLLEHGGELSEPELERLKVGRHFRYGGSKIIVGRNEEENEALRRLKGPGEVLLEAIGWGSPTTLLSGEVSEGAIRIAASLTARYSDCKLDEVPVAYWDGERGEISIAKADEGLIEELRVKWRGGRGRFIFEARGIGGK
ncbi:MAG: hypothetical protein QXK34_03655 [Candidatus Bathyarchaeia archaeon]